jgi:hypothetical protein
LFFFKVTTRVCANERGAAVGLVIFIDADDSVSAPGGRCAKSLPFGGWIPRGSDYALTLRVNASDRGRERDKVMTTLGAQI